MATGFTVEDFLEKYPEFASEDSPEETDALVEQMLDEAKGRVSRTTFGDRYEEALGAMLAHLLWSSEFGVTLRGDSDASDNDYIRKFKAIKRECVVPFVVT